MNNYQLPPVSLLKAYQPDYVFLPNANFVSMHSVISSDEFQNEQSMALPIAAGRSFDGKLILFDLAKTPHLFLGGVDFRLRDKLHFGFESIITPLLFKKKPSEIRFVTIGKSICYGPLQKLLKPFLVPIPRSIHSEKYAYLLRIIDELNWVKVEMNRRLDMLAHNEDNFPYLIVLASDTIDDFVRGWEPKKLQKELQDFTLQLLANAHKVGIHLVFHQWYFKNDLITKSIVEQFQTRIAFHMDEAKPTLMFAGTKDPIHFDIGNGEMLYYHNGETIKGVCPRIEQSEIDGILKYIESRPL